MGHSPTTVVHCGQWPDEQTVRSASSPRPCGIAAGTASHGQDGIDRR
jgi:hypothetical protein